MTSRPLRFGVNYTPRTNWFHSWLDYRELRENLRADFRAIASLGLDHVRIFPLWAIMQPNRTLIRPQALADVADMATLAIDEGLDVCVDVFQGHLSSYDFLPSWVLSWHQSNIFSNPQVISGQRELIKRLAQALSSLPQADFPGVKNARPGEKGLIGLSLGNEIGQFAASRHPLRHEITVEESEAWLKQMFDTTREALPQGCHTHSYDDDLFFDPAHPFTPLQAVKYGDLTTIHSWIFGHLGRRLPADDPSYGFFARFLVELARSWGAKDMWMQEVGAPSPWISETGGRRFVTDTLSSLASAPSLRAITWWCSHNVSEDLADFPQLEYSLGLFDTKGQLRCLGADLRDFISDYVPGECIPLGAPVSLSANFGTDFTQIAEVRRASSPVKSGLFEAWLDQRVDNNFASICL